MWFGVVMMEDDVVLLAGSLGLDGCMEAVELGQVDVAVKGMNFFVRSVWNRPSLLHIIVIPPKAEALLTNLGDDLPMDNACSIPPNTPHELLAMDILRYSFRGVAFVNANLLPLEVFEQ